MTGTRFQDRGEGVGLIVGGDSLVGTALRAHCRELGIAAEVTTRRRGGQEIFLDLSDPDFAPLDRTNWSFAIVCAAVTDMRACQHDPAATRRINVANTLELIRRLGGRGTHAVFLSSSQVFDGEMPAPDEEAPASPKNEYGAQKLAVEQAIAREGLPAAVLRLTKVLADRPVGLFKGWFDALAAGRPAEAATNIALSPIAVADVATAAARLALGRHRGLWHLGASDEIGYFEAAKLMAEMCGLPVALVQGRVLTEEQVPAIYRHRYVTLSCDKIARSLDMPARAARAVLDELFARFTQPTAVH